MDVAAAEWAPGCDPMEREGHMLLGALLGTSFFELPRAVIFTEQKACAAWIKKKALRAVGFVGVLEALCLSL